VTRALVILSPLSPDLAGGARVAAARAALVPALRASAGFSDAPRDLPWDSWPRAASGAPEPQRGWHASWSDTRGLLAALVSPRPIGLDAEWRGRARWQAARERFRASGELELLEDEGRDAVLSLWCAKEALLKRTGRGLADLARCPLLGVEPGRDGAERRFVLEHRGRREGVLVRALERHLLAWAAPEELEIELGELGVVA
jgi:hypothetical protein